MGQPVVHFEIVGSDLDLLGSYYGDLFGWELQKHPEITYATIDREGNTNADGAGIGGGIGGMEGIPDHVTFYVEVPDVAEALERAEQLGGKKLNGPHEVPGTDVVLGQFADPEGHMIGVVQATS